MPGFFIVLSRALAHFGRLSCTCRSAPCARIAGRARSYVVFWAPGGMRMVPGFDAAQDSPLSRLRERVGERALLKGIGISANGV
ncbi:hypothetical protein AOX63_16780 [Pseudomonas sp. ADP]|nr:hypothetical protein AOX63_16780 [Pseudomonas sp. ADP]OBP07260.1 hypothetical protein BAE52_29715 [Pseudomonas sp. EGD-AKN5]